MGTAQRDAHISGADRTARGIPAQISEVWVLVPETASAPMALGLERINPNPTARETYLSLAIPRSGNVKLSIYDVAGRRVANVVNQVLPQGWRTIAWDGRDAVGRPVASGMYFARLESSGQVRVGKIVVAR
jgi:hypothetical protein